MNKAKLLELARKAQLQYGSDEEPLVSVVKFAELVRADEREACAQICDQRAIADTWEGCYADACAEAIRERGRQMNRETVIERLYKAFNVSTTDSNVNIPGLHAVLDALVAAEREACAKVCEDEIKRVKPIYSVVAENALKAIRARGEK